jgi:PKD repeat protein
VYNACGSNNACQTITIACAGTPTSSFSYTGTALTYNFTFTGTQPADSIVWDFGDGAGANTAAAVHTYTTAGNYQVCATVYNACGSNNACQQVSVSVGVNSLNAMDGVNVYPNPLTDRLFIDGAAAGTEVQLNTLTGQKVYSGTLKGNKETISTSGLSAGIYLLQLSDRHGNRAMYKIVKR